MPPPAKPGAPVHAPGKAGVPMKAPDGAPPADTWNPLECAGIPHRLRMTTPDLPNQEVEKDVWRTQVQTAINVIQWRAKLTTIFGLTPQQAGAFGTRETACAEAFRLAGFQ